MAFFFTRIIRNIILLVILVNAAHFYLRWKSYNISAKDFKAESNKVANPTDGLSATSRFVSEMRRKYGARISQDLYWIPFNGGSGLPLKAQFVYADLTEFVVVLSSPSHAVGRSGFHWGNTTCTVLAGEVSRFSDVTSSPVKENFRNGTIFDRLYPYLGQNFRHGQFESYVYEFGENSYLACYGRGMQPVNALWPTLGALSNGDVFSLGQLYYAYGRATVDNIIYSAQHLFDHYKKQVSKQEL